MATVFLYENSSRFQYIFKYIFKMLSISFLNDFSAKDRAEETICNDRRSLLHTAGGPGDEGPGSTEDLAFYNIKNRLKNHLCCAFFCVLLCVL